MADNTFKVNAYNYMGGEYQEYRNEMYAMALATPSQYFELRKAVVGKIKEEALKNMYTQFYNLLTAGVDEKGNKITSSTNNVTLPPPNYPSQRVGDFALEAASVLNGVLDKCIDIVLPADFKHSAETRTAAIGNAAISGASPP